jgi:hypothetical protein
VGNLPGKRSAVGRALYVRLPDGKRSSSRWRSCSSPPDQPGNSSKADNGTHQQDQLKPRGQPQANPERPGWCLCDARAGKLMPRVGRGATRCIKAWSTSRGLRALEIPLRLLSSCPRRLLLAKAIKRQRRRLDRRHGPIYHRRPHLGPPRQLLTRRKISSSTTAPMKALMINATIPVPK